MSLARDGTGQIWLGAMIALWTQISGGCVVEPDAGPLVTEGPQELDEFSCTSNSISLTQPDGAAVNMQFPNCSIVDSTATSNDTTYGQPLCPNQFVTEVRQANGHQFTAFVEAIPASDILTKTACTGILVNGAAWGFNGTSWTTLGTIQSAGIWHPGSCGDLFCIPDTCQLGFYIVTAQGYSKIRVAGWQGPQRGFDRGRVRTGVQAGLGPC